MPSFSSSIHLPVQHFPQQQTGECLAACSAMVLTYLGISTPYHRLLSLLKVQYFGAPFSNLQRLEQLRVKVIIGTGNLELLYQQLAQNHPCIVSVQTRELPHWKHVPSEHAVVVVGMDERHVYLHDPASPIAPIQTPRGDFDLAWLEQDERYGIISR